MIFGYLSSVINCIANNGNNSSNVNLNSSLFALGGAQVRTYGKAILQ